MFFIEALVYDFDEVSQLIYDEKTGAWIELTGRAYDRDIFQRSPKQMSGV
jgi:hypothetical protein